MRKEIRVLHCILEFYPVFTGHGLYLTQLFKFLDKGVKNSILSLSFNKYISYEKFNDIDIYRVPFSPGGKFSDMRQSLALLLSLFKYRHTFDVLHLHGHVDLYGLIALFCKLYNKKIVMQMVLMGSDDPLTIKKSYKLMWARFPLFKLMDKFICISSPLVQACLDAGIPENKVILIPQGVNNLKFSPPTLDERSRLRRDFGFTDEDRIVTFVGAIIERKGVDVLVDAWKEIQSRVDNAVLLLVGPYEFGDEDKNCSTLSVYVESIIGKIRKDDLKVVLVGRSDQVDLLLKMSDVFVLPSRKEGFGNVILEAMACGVPPVVTYMDGVALETVENGFNGYIVSGESDLSDKVSLLLSDKCTYSKMSKNSIAKVDKEFSMTVIAPKYSDVYDTLMGGGD